MMLREKLLDLAAALMPFRRRPTPITCQEALAVLEELLDGELAPDEAGRVRSHVDACEQCYPQLRRQASFRSAVSLAVRGQPAPEGLRIRLRILLDDLAVRSGSSEARPTHLG